MNLPFFFSSLSCVAVTQPPQRLTRHMTYKAIPVPKRESCGVAGFFACLFVVLLFCWREETKKQEQKENEKKTGEQGIKRGKENNQTPPSPALPLLLPHLSPLFALTSHERNNKRHERAPGVGASQAPTPHCHQQSGCKRLCSLSQVWFLRMGEDEGKEAREGT